jgi:hypothetical protein
MLARICYSDNNFYKVENCFTSNSHFLSQASHSGNINRTRLNGNITQIVNAPNLETGTGPITSGKARMSKINAFGFQWELSGKSSKHEPVDWKGP